MIAKDIVDRLRILGIDAVQLVPEDADVPLSVRVRRVNKLAATYGCKNCLCVSVHCNASINGKARGWEIHTCKGQTLSDVYASIFYDEAKKVLSDNTKMRGDWSDGDPDWDSNFAILRDTICPSVLTENGFMDNEDDCRYMLSEEGRKEIVSLHVSAIIRIVEMV
jgi:N-acetylmuramoyl-L-alanine amidase